MRTITFTTDIANLSGIRVINVINVDTVVVTFPEEEIPTKNVWHWLSMHGVTSQQKQKHIACKPKEGADATPLFKIYFYTFVKSGGSMNYVTDQTIGGCLLTAVWV
jgi:hypothetical protein